MDLKIIKDARTGKESEHKIAEKIVSGVMKDSGLPKISNVVVGTGKSMRAAAESGKGKSTPTEVVPKEERSKTKQESGGARYIGSMSKMRR